MSGKSRREQIEGMLRDGMEDDGFLRYCLAMEYKTEGNSAQAVTCFRELLQHMPEYVPGYMQLGQLLNQLGEEDEAKKTYREGISVARKKGDAHAEGEMSGFLAMLD